MTAYRRVPPYAAVIAALILLPLLGALAGHYLAPASEPSTATFAVPTAAGAEAFPGTRTMHSGRGTFRVPEQAPPGDYLITPSGSVLNCTWKVLKARDGKPKSLIAGGSPNRGASDEVTIGPSARFVVFLGDCTWAEVQP
jgi:hypothetical protein